MQDVAGYSRRHASPRAGAGVYPKRPADRFETLDHADQANDISPGRIDIEPHPLSMMVTLRPSASFSECTERSFSGGRDDSDELDERCERFHGPQISILKLPHTPH